MGVCLCLCVNVHVCGCVRVSACMCLFGKCVLMLWTLYSLSVLGFVTLPVQRPPRRLPETRRHVTSGHVKMGLFPPISQERRVRLSQRVKKMDIIV